MDFSNQHYVRLYKVDTTNQLMVSWEARGLWRLLLTKFDRAGILDLGAHGKRGVCVQIPGAGVSAWAKIEPLLEELLRDGCAEYHERGDQSYLVVPNYIEANEATQSDAARSRAYRERKRDRARARDLGIIPTDEIDTARDETETSRVPDDATGGTGATASRSAPHGVTLSLTKLNKTKHIHSGSPQGGTTNRVGQPPTPEQQSQHPSNNTQPQPQPARANPTPKRKTASRLPEHWKPTAELYEYALTSERVHFGRKHVDHCAEDFRDHWHSATKNATKRDWAAAFKRWLRTHRERNPQIPKGVRELTAEQRAELAAKREASERAARAKLVAEQGRPVIAPDRAAASATLEKLLAQADEDPPKTRVLLVAE